MAVSNGELLVFEERKEIFSRCMNAVDVHAGGGAGSSGGGRVLSDAVNSATDSRQSVGQKNRGEGKKSKLWVAKRAEMVMV